MIRAALLLALAGAAPAAARDPLAGRVAGPPRECVSLSSDGTSGLSVFDRSSIVYRQGSKLWRNVPIGHCSLRPLDTIVVEVFGGQLCRNDRFRTLSPQQSIPSAPCRLDRWTPYVKVK